MMKLRVSSGTANYLGLKRGRSKEKVTTAYLMIPGGVCRGGCTFCPQAKGDSKWLSRVSWPEYEIDEFSDELKNSDLQRVCIQSPDIDGYEAMIIEAVDALKKCGKPISVSAPPLSEDTLDEIKGPVTHLGVGIDAATDDLRKKTKLNYPPLVFWDYLGLALDKMGEDNVIAHFIVGMGEDLDKIAWSSYRAAKAGANISLFSYQSEEKTPEIEYYRRSQLVTYLIQNGYPPYEAIWMVENKDERVQSLIEDGEVFRTRGCPGCNRPYYTTRPSDEHRNFPRRPRPEEIDNIKSYLGY